MKIWLTTMALLAGALAMAETRTVLFLGDSLTAGFGLDVEQAYPAAIQEKIDAAGLDWKVRNAGRSGDTTAGGLARLSWLMRQPVDVLVIALGGNDFLRGLPLDETRRNLREMILRAREQNPGIRIVLAGMVAPPNMGADYREGFDSIYPELAEELGVARVPFLLLRVGGVPELNLADGIHPNPEGQEIVAENVWAVLEPLLREERGG